MSVDTTMAAVLAVEDALDPADKERILGKFRNSNLNGANVSDILDILDNHDALLELREPFYEDGQHDEAKRLNGWAILDENFVDTYETRLHSRLIGMACLAVAILTDKVPTPQAVASLARKAADVAATRWPGGEYPSGLA